LKVGRITSIAKIVVSKVVKTNIIIGINKFCQLSLFFVAEPIKIDRITALIDIIIFALLSAKEF